MMHETATPVRNPSPDELLHTLRLCLCGERVLTASLRRELAARGLDLEALALQQDRDYEGHARR